MQKSLSKRQFPQIFRWFAQKSLKTVSWQKISAPGNQNKLWHFMLWKLHLLMLFIVQRFNFFRKICLICLYKDFLSSQITKNSIIFKLPSPHVLIWPLTCIYFNTGCQICCLYVFNLFKHCVCPIYSSLQPLQIKT